MTDGITDVDQTVVVRKIRLFDLTIKINSVRLFVEVQQQEWDESNGKCLLELRSNISYFYLHSIFDFNFSADSSSNPGAFGWNVGVPAKPSNTVITY